MPVTRPVAKLHSDGVYHVRCHAKAIAQIPLGKAKIVKHLPSYLYCLVCNERLEQISIRVTPETRQQAHATPRGASEAESMVIKINDRGQSVTQVVQDVLRRAAQKARN